jgi:hypothetical protein
MEICAAKNTRQYSRTYVFWIKDTTVLRTVGAGNKWQIQCSLEPKALTSETPLNTGFLLRPPSIRMCVDHHQGHSRVFDYQKMPQMVNHGITMVSATLE